MKKAVLASIVILVASQFTFAAYINGYVWDFYNDFSSTTPQVKDSENNVAWEYRGGAYNNAPSGAGLYSTWASWQTPPAWEGNTAPYSHLGRGFLQASAPGSGDLFPFLVWKSNVNGQVQVDIDLTNANGNCQEYIFKNDTVLASQTGTSADFSYSQLLDVTQGDTVTIKFGSWGNAPTANAAFTVTLVPEPATILTLLTGLAGLVYRKK